MAVAASETTAPSASSFLSTAERTYGRNALANLFDVKAKDPSVQRPYAYVLKTPNPDDGFDTVSYAMMANAINRASRWLVNDVGLVEGEVFAYMGPSDLRYIIFALAAAKTGRKIMLPSLRNTIPAQMALFERTSTRIILYGAELDRTLQPLFAAMPDIEKREALGYKEVIDDTLVPLFESRELTDEMMHEPIFLLHTSGTSGNPKPVSQSALFWLRTMSFIDIPEDGDIHNNINVYGGRNLLHFFPSFHLAGIHFHVMAAFLDASVVINHPAAPITAEQTKKILDQGVATALGAADSILTDLTKTPGGIEALSKLDLVIYGGGPLSPQTGTLLARHVKNMSSLIGMTENALLHCVRLNGTTHWECLKFNSKVGYRFEEASPGRYELVVSLDPKYAMFHPASLIFPDLHEFHTKDLYSCISDVDNIYRYEGRRDDLIVLSNGEKINPVPMEAIIAGDPAVRNAVFVGEHYFLPSLLVELREGYAVNSQEESRKMIDKLWPVISKANLEAPRFARVPKSLVYILAPTESFSRSGKMTIQRQITVSKFAAKVGEMYAAAEEGLLIEGLGFEDASSFESVQQLARNLYRQVLVVDVGDDDPSKELEDDDDVFELGLDSLQVAVAVQKLKAALRSQGLGAMSNKINPSFFYASPSSSRLACSINNLINGTETHANGHMKSGIKRANNAKENDIHVDIGIDRQTRLQYFIDKYSRGLEMKLPPKKERLENLTIILTGSTGSLGSYLLDSLLSSPRISTVICLNRTDSAQHRQTTGNKLKDLPTPWESPSEEENFKSVEFLTIDLSKSDLGLGPETYKQLLSKVNAIIHCAWKVDFNHTIESFEKVHIAGMRHLIDLSRQCEYQAPIVFVSSISTAFNWIQKYPGQVVPEYSLHDLDSPEFLGYGESKYVAERLLEAHSASSGWTSCFLRVGQIAGPVLSSSPSGVWNIQEWFPSLVASSKYLGLLPNSLGTMGAINWVPVDIMARIIVQLLHATCDRNASANIINKNSTSGWLVGGYRNLEKTLTKRFTQILSVRQDGDFDGNNASNDTMLAVYNLVNPHVITWPALLETVQTGIGGRDKIRITSLSEWIEALERSTQENHGFVVKSNPATKLLGFWQRVGNVSRNNAVASNGILENRGNGYEKLNGEYEVANLQRDSSEAANLNAVSPEWMRIWLEQWGF